MAVMTIRAKNQITLPKAIMEQVGLKQGDPIEFDALPTGGIGVFPLGRRASAKSAWDVICDILERAPGVQDIDVELAPRDLELREVRW